MNLKEAIEILKENHYKIKSPLLNEADLHFSTADQFLSFTQSRGYYQNTVKIGTINTMLSEKELNAASKDIMKNTKIILAYLKNTLNLQKNKDLV